MPAPSKREARRSALAVVSPLAEMLIERALELPHGLSHQRPVEVSEEPARKPLPALFQGHACARMDHEREGGRSISSCPVLPELDAGEVLRVLVAVVRGRHQTQGGPVRDGERLPGREKVSGAVF